MRVPQSPKSLRRVMTVSSVSRDDDEGAGSSSDDGVNNNNNNFKKSRTNANEAARPPRPTYTARYKDGKYTVGVEATLFTAKVEIQNDKSENGESKNADEDPKRVDPAPPSFHRSRDRTRISAVQRLVERKLAQKERERLRERELERDRLGHSLGGKLRSSSSGGSCYVRERSWDPTYRRNISCSAAEQSNNDGDASQSDVKSRSEKENEYLASLLWRTSRSCSGTRRRGTQSDCEEEVAKTIITIGPGKPTRIREHSPSKRSPTSEQPPYTFENEKEDKPTPLNLKPVPPARDPSPSKKSESRFQNSSPLKSTGLFREFSRTTTTTSTSSFSTSSKPNDRQRKTSFTTERTFQVNVDKEAAEKARKLSIDCNYVYERSTPTFSTFSQSESQKTSSTSSLSSSSFSSTSSADSGTEKEPIRLSRLRAPTFAKEKSPELVSDPNPEPPIRERKTSRRIFISSAFNNKPSDISADETSSSASSTEDSVVNGSDDAGSQFSSASSRLLFNLSSGYRYHRAAAAANSTLHTVNINVTNCATNNKTFNTNDATYPRRRFSQEHAPLEEDAFDEHVFVTKPARQPVRKISLPVRPMREAPAMRREVSSLADQKKEEGNELYKISNYREALQRYSEAISLCPDTPSFYGNRAACYMMLAQYTRALEDAKTSVQLDNQFTKGYIRVAKCCIAMGDIVSANQALDTALRLEPNNSAVIQEKNSLQTLQKHQSDAETAYNNKDHRKALYCLDRALDIATASRQLKLLRAECLAYLGRYGEAQEVANDLLRQDSTNVDAIFVRGLCLYYEDNVDKAFTHFQQVLRFAPDHQRAKDAYKKAKLLRQKKEDGNNAFKNGKFSEAYDLYTEALAIDSCNKFTNAKLYFNRATVAARLKKLKESVDDCTSALSLDDKYVKAQLRRAKSYMELEMYDEAVRDYEALLRTDRGSQEYRHLLQQAKLELKKSKRKDYYKILGVERGASDEEIKRAYRKRALVHHPDRHSGSSDEEKKEHEKKFKEIGEAYGVLSDSKKRSRYDNGCDIDDLDGGGGHGGYGAEIDPDKIFQAFFGGGVPGGMHGGAHSFGFGGGPGQMPGGFSFQFG